MRDRKFEPRSERSRVGTSYSVKRPTGSAATATAVWFGVVNDQRLFENFRTTTTTTMDVLLGRERGENGPATSMGTQFQNEMCVRLCCGPYGNEAILYSVLLLFDTGNQRGGSKSLLWAARCFSLDQRTGQTICKSK